MKNNRRTIEEEHAELWQFFRLEVPAHGYEVENMRRHVDSCSMTQSLYADLVPDVPGAPVHHFAFVEIPSAYLKSIAPDSHYPLDQWMRGQISQWLNAE